MNDLENLESYLISEYDTNVVFGKDETDAFYYDVNCIGINTNRTKEIQLFCLLHEAGHLILRSMDAWKEGRDLATLLGIEINDNKWDRYWKHQVYKYVRWAVEQER